MSSNMTPIDEGFIQYPVPGVDNDSQGFRDRYAILRNNLNFAREEINLLIENTAKVNENSNFRGNKIIDSTLSGTTFETNITAIGGISNSQNVNLAEGLVHVIRCENDLTLTLSGWEENRYAFMRLLLTSDGSQRTITINGSSNTTAVYDDNSSEWLSATDTTRTIRVESELNPIIIEASSFNGGEVILLRVLRQSSSGGAGVSSLSNLSDVSLGALISHQILSYNAQTGSFVNTSTVRSTSGNDIIDLSSSEIKNSAGNTVIDLTSGEIKTPSGNILIDTTTSEIKRADGTVFLDLSTGIIKNRLGNTIIDSEDDIPIFENVELDPIKLRSPRYDNAGRDNSSINLGKVGSIIYNTQTDEYQAYVGGVLGGWRVLTMTPLEGPLNAPSFTTAARGNLTPNPGDIIFNSTENKHQGYDGTQWNDMY